MSCHSIANPFQLRTWIAQLCDRQTHTYILRVTLHWFLAGCCYTAGWNRPVFKIGCLGHFAQVDRRRATRRSQSAPRGPRHPPPRGASSSIQSNMRFITRRTTVDGRLLEQFLFRETRAAVSETNSRTKHRLRSDQGRRAGERATGAGRRFVAR